MKKFIVLCSMIVALGFVTTGCGGGDKPADTKKTDAVKTEKAADASADGEDHTGHDH